MRELNNIARLNVLNVAQRVGGVHFGGIFSIIDFLVAYYSKYGTFVNSNSKRNTDHSDLFMSKGHCYLAQLAAVDAINQNSNHCDKYLLEGSGYFGHPAKSEENFPSPVSSGALGQGIVMSQGVALAKKLTGSQQKTWCIIGDGELNEGSCQEALAFASQHQLNIVVVLDNNKQVSLALTEDVLSNGDISQRISAFDINYLEINGHCSSSIDQALIEINNLNGPIFLNLNTIKGKGVSFMEKVTKWHSTRLRNDEYELAAREINRS
jgi:transketolase